MAKERALNTSKRHEFVPHKEVKNEDKVVTTHRALPQIARTLIHLQRIQKMQVHLTPCSSKRSKVRNDLWRSQTKTRTLNRGKLTVLAEDTRASTAAKSV